MASVVIPAAPANSSKIKADGDDSDADDGDEGVIMCPNRSRQSESAVRSINGMFEGNIGALRPTAQSAIMGLWFSKSHKHNTALMRFAEKSVVH